MTELYLSDLMKLGGIDPDEAVLIRHSVGDIAFAKCYENGSESIEQYTRLQAEHFSDGFKYWLGLAKRAEVLDFSGLIQ